MKNFLNHSMNNSRTLMININIRSVPLHAIFLSFLKYAQKSTETILSNANQQNHETTLNKYYKPIYCSKSGMKLGEEGEARGRKKTLTTFFFHTISEHFFNYY